MRIIAGEFRSRKLKSVPGLDVRPTPDRLRESLFNILTPRLPGTVFADVYAGSGAVGIEALSRGASRVILVEKHRTALEVIRDNLRTLGIEKDVAVVAGSAVAVMAEVLKDQKPDIVFFDPPYQRTGEYAQMLALLAESGCSIAIAQHTSRLVLEDRYGCLQKTRVVRQGDNALSFFGRATELAVSPPRED